MLYVPVIIAVLAVLFYVSPIGWNANWEVPTDGETQRAAVFTSRAGIEGVEIIVVKKPQIKNPNDVLVKIKYAALNPIDNEVLKKFIHPVLCVPSSNTYCGVGLEGAGEVVSIGSNVTKFSIGTEVVFQSLGGSVAEYIVLSEINVMSVPKGWSALEASTVGAVTFTSYNTLVEVCQINSNTPSLYDGSKERKVVLIIGGGSSCGQTGITIAKSLNEKHLVIATCGTRSLDRCKSLGADIVIDYHKEKNISDALIKQGINSVDIIYEAVNSVSESVSIKYGCMTLIDAGDSLPRFLKNLITRKIWGENIHFFDGLSVDIDKTRGKIIQLIESNAVQKLKIEIFQGLDKTREALTYLHKSVTASKVVVQIY